MKAIVIKNLSKSYFVSRDDLPNYSTLRDTIASVFMGKSATKLAREIKALDNMSLTINKGDRIGIIGHNGAGKSTLLKVISQITRPTSGEVVIYGRVGSLLEVGTGFHPELTAKENIYLNGAILGMCKNEISAKLIDIINFADIGDRLNTPVKFLSSGLYMRLAFSVAAHLDSDTILVDEVLSVGDIAFQAKCIGKIDEISSQGRTVLFVSHNLTTIRQLCDKAILLTNGKITEKGEVNYVINKYLSLSGGIGKTVWLNQDATELSRHSYIQSVRIFSGTSTNGNVFLNTDDIVVELNVQVKKPYSDLKVGIDLYYQGGLAFRSQQVDSFPNPIYLPKGENTLQCIIPANLLNKGSYFVAPILARHAVETFRPPQSPVLEFTVDIDSRKNPFHGLVNTINQPGPVFPQLKWSLL